MFTAGEAKNGKPNSTWCLSCTFFPLFFLQYFTNISLIHAAALLNVSNDKVVIFPTLVKYLSFCKHTDVGGGIRGISIFSICEDGAIEEGQIITAWVVQLHLGAK